jgi:hypothetical protein
MWTKNDMRPLDRPETGARAHRRRQQDQAVGLDAAIGRNHGDGAAHALAREIERHVGVFLSQQLDHRPGVIDQGVGARPAAARRTAAEAALVVGVGGNAVLGPDRRRVLEGVAIVAPAVQAQDHRPGRAGFGDPYPERQRGAVGRHVFVSGKCGRAHALARRNDGGRTRGEHDREDKRSYHQRA